MVYLLALRSKIFARLLRYRPTPQDLTEWMKNVGEIDRRIAGTELEAMIPKGAAGVGRSRAPSTRRLPPSSFYRVSKKVKAGGPQRDGRPCVRLALPPEYTHLAREREAFGQHVAGLPDSPAHGIAPDNYNSRRQITAVLTDALVTKLHGDPRSEHRLEWTEEERLDSAFLAGSADRRFCGLRLSSRIRSP